ncbi:hypothetical protein K4F52_000628 [Lecanicillium sp. MT-2017a]|nr:hypothetical protein K4F52_000628 [Lecanicillium sp. MT-2017a]
MAKAKGAPGVQNKNIYTRASYLYQAASYLATQSQGSPEAADKPRSSEEERKAAQNISRQLLSDMRAVSLKVLIRQSPELKRTVCRYCDTLLVEGESCSSAVENASRGGRKPWADVLVVRCLSCDNVRRYPVSAAPRQKRRALREAEAKAEKEKKKEEEEQKGKKESVGVEEAKAG